MPKAELRAITQCSSKGAFNRNSLQELSANTQCSSKGAFNRNSMQALFAVEYEWNNLKRENRQWIYPEL